MSPALSHRCRLLLQPTDQNRVGIASVWGSTPRFLRFHFRSCLTPPAAFATLRQSQSCDARPYAGLIG